MAYALYVTHPEVVIDPQVPTPRWGLSDTGRSRAEAFAARGLIPAGARIIASSERKAVETAEAIAAASAQSFESVAAFDENDRSSTGYLPPPVFEQYADKLFAFPADSVSGWETAHAAQTRIVAAVEQALRAHDPARPIVFVGHGCVGTLLKCHLAGRAIARAEDQRRMAHPGGGNVFAFSLPEMRLLSDWVSFEAFAGVPGPPA
jgi:broad specificity phosphatase PhoE